MNTSAETFARAFGEARQGRDGWWNCRCPVCQTTKFGLKDNRKGWRSTASRVATRSRSSVSEISPETSSRRYLILKRCGEKRKPRPETGRSELPWRSGSGPSRRSRRTTRSHICTYGRG